MAAVGGRKLSCRHCCKSPLSTTIMRCFPVPQCIPLVDNPWTREKIMATQPLSPATTHQLDFLILCPHVRVCQNLSQKHFTDDSCLQINLEELCFQYSALEIQLLIISFTCRHRSHYIISVI